MAGLLVQPGSSSVPSTPSGRTSLPILGRYGIALSVSQNQNLQKIADRLTATEPALVSSDIFGLEVESGLLDGPALLIGDSREIALARPEESQRLEYRMAALGGDGDTLLVGGSRSADFENYLRDILALGKLDVIPLPAGGSDGRMPLATRCAHTARAFDHIVARARAAGNLSIIPYIGFGSVWLLATSIAKRAGTQVRVAAPLPRLSCRVNDKVWFTRRVGEVLGIRAHPVFRSVYGPSALAARVSQLAREADRVVVKVPDSAGAAGNISLRAADVKGISASQLRGRLLRTLRSIGWTGAFPLLVEVWDSPVLSSPSVQTWIPKRSHGPPLLEGVYEQIVTGATGKFIGSVPARLPECRMEQLVSEAFQLATLFQYLGYFGRCSFDAVVAGEDYTDATAHWLECNGRWGGVSIPMTVANRLTDNGKDGCLVVVQQSQLDFKPCSINQARAILGSDLFRPKKSKEGIVIVSPFGLESGSGINIMAIAQNSERATRIAEQATQRLTARPK